MDRAPCMEEVGVKVMIGALSPLGWRLKHEGEGEGRQQGGVGRRGEKEEDLPEKFTLDHAR